MASPFTIFRKYSKVLLALFGVMLMIAFTLGSVLDDLFRMRTDSGDPEVAQSAYGPVTASSLFDLRNRRNLVLTFLMRAKLMSVQAQFGADANFMNDPNFMNQAMNFVASQVQQLFGDLSERGLVQDWILAQQAEQMGFVVTDAVVTDFIRSQTSDLVSSDQMNRILRELPNHQGRARPSKAALYDALRFELLVLRMRESYLATQALTPQQHWEYFTRLRRQATVELVALPAESVVGSIADPGDAVLEAFFNQYRDQLPVPGSPEPGFKVPHKVDLQWLVARYEKFLAPEQVTDAEVAAHYEKFKDSRYRYTPPGPHEAWEPIPGPSDMPSDAATKAAEEGAAKEGAPKESTPPPTQPAPGTPTPDKPAPEKPAPSTPPTSTPAPEKPAADKPAASPTPPSTEKPTPPPQSTPDSKVPEKKEPEKKEPEKKEPEKKESEKKPENQEPEKKEPTDGEDDLIQSEQLDADEPPAKAAEPAQGNKPAGDATPPTDTKPATEAKPGETPPAPAAAKSPEDTPPAAATEKPADEKPQTTPVTSPPAPSAGATPPKPEPPLPLADVRSLPHDILGGPDPQFDPLWKVESSIRSELAKEQAAKKIQEALSAVTETMRDYSQQMTAFDIEQSELAKKGKVANMPTPPALQWSALAEQASTTAGIPESVIADRTGLLALYEMSQFPGVNEASLSSGERLVDYSYRQMRRYSVVEAVDLAGNRYVAIKLGDQPMHTPTFAEARSDVLRTWKLRQARDSIQKRAEQLVAQARTSGTSLKETFANQPELSVIETPPFSWMSRGPTGNFSRQAAAEVTQLPGVIDGGNEFMQGVFRMQQAGEVGVTFNQPRTIAYVVRITSMSPSIVELQAQYTPLSQTDVMHASLGERREQMQAWLDDRLAAAQLKWIRDPLDDSE